MARKAKSTKRKRMDVVPESSFSSQQTATPVLIRRPRKQEIMNRRKREKGMNKGKSLAIEPPPEPESEFEHNKHIQARRTRSSSIRTKLKNPKIIAFAHNRKRGTTNLSSSEDEFDRPRVNYRNRAKPDADCKKPKVPETSLSSRQTTTPVLIKRPRKQEIVVQKNRCKGEKAMDKGKSLAIEPSSEPESEFEHNKHIYARRTRSSSIHTKPKKPKIIAFAHTRKRDRRNLSSSEDEFDRPRGTRAKPDADCHKPKEWDMLMRGVPFFSAKMDSYNSESTIAKIKEVLTDKQYILMKQQCLGKCLDLHQFKIQPQIVHNILFREVSQNTRDELWVDMNGKILRFGIGEFAAITGLKCTGSCNKVSIEPISGGLFDKYFKCLVPLTRQVIRQRFVTANFESDEDAVKIASLHFIVNFLMGAQVQLSVDRALVDLVDSGAFNDYPWGKEVFKFTIEHLKGQCYGKENIADKNFKTHGTRYIYYRLRGFVLSLQMWFYEVCAATHGIACIPIRYATIPRMLKWRCVGDHKNKNIKPNLFSLPPHQFNNIIPTEDEQRYLKLGDFFKVRNQWMRNDAPESSAPVRIQSSTSRVDDISEMQKLLACDLDKLGGLFKDFSADVLHRLQSIEAVVMGPSDKNMNGKKGETGLSKDISNFPTATNVHSLDDIPEPDISTQELDDIVRSVKQQSTRPHHPSIDNLQDNKKASADYNSRVGAPPPSTIVDQNVQGDDTLPLSRPSFSAILDGLDDYGVHVSPNTTTANGVRQEKVAYISGKVSSAPLPSNLAPSVQADDRIPLGMASLKNTTAAVDATAVNVLGKTINVTVAAPQIVQRQSVRNAQKKGGGTCPLDDFLWDLTDLEKATNFDDWLRKGTLMQPKKTSIGVQYYKARCGDIKPAFDFNVAIVSSKNWFHILDGPGEEWDETHVDVIFYYLRKIALYSKFVVHNRYTTTDPFFHDTISILYITYTANPSDTTTINMLSPIVDYILGYRLICGTSWFDVDYILFPMNIRINETVHWMLGRLDILNGLFWAYNARFFKEADVIEAVKPYTTIIPLFLDMVGFYKLRPDIDLQSASYKGKHATAPFKVAIAEILPVIQPGDSGLHMAAHAEYFISEDDIMLQEFDVAIHRKRIAYLLWNHARMKVDIDYHSTDESPGPLPAETRGAIFSQYLK